MLKSDMVSAEVDKMCDHWYSRPTTCGFVVTHKWLSLN
jgi:hypothetical protein